MNKQDEIIKKFNAINPNIHNKNCKGMPLYFYASNDGCSLGIDIDGTIYLYGPFEDCLGELEEDNALSTYKKYYKSQTILENFK